MMLFMHYFSLLSWMLLQLQANAELNGFIPNKQCYMANEDCSLSRFETGDLIKIYPAGETACLDLNAGDYFFIVRKGVSDKLLFYFQGIYSHSYSPCKKNKKLTICISDTHIFNF